MLKGREGFDGIVLIVLLEPHRHIYRSTWSSWSTSKGRNKSYAILCFLNKHYTQHPPAVTTVATQTMRLEKNQKIIVAYAMLN